MDFVSDLCLLVIYAYEFNIFLKVFIFLNTKFFMYKYVARTVFSPPLFDFSGSLVLIL